MFFIVETQVYQDGQAGTLVTTKDQRNEADSEYYRVLQAAAISQVPVHGAILFDESCMPLMHKAYAHRETGDTEQL